MMRSKRLAIWCIAATLAGVLGFTITRTRADATPANGGPPRASGSVIAWGSRPTATVGAPSPLDEEDDDVRVDPLSGPPMYHPRPADEWQGMRVDLSIQALCSGADSCGLAMACNGQKCGPCSNDGDCAAGEACVLDHCLRAEQVTFRGRADCAIGQLCVLSGYSADPRGNADLRSSCLTPVGGRERATEPERYQVTEPAHPAPIEAPGLLDDVEAHARDR